MNITVKQLSEVYFESREYSLTAIRRNAMRMILNRCKPDHKDALRKIATAATVTIETNHQQMIHH